MMSREQLWNNQIKIQTSSRVLRFFFLKINNNNNNNNNKRRIKKTDNGMIYHHLRRFNMYKDMKENGLKVEELRKWIKVHALINLI